MPLLVEHCRVFLDAQGGVLLALLLAGLLGSLTHCVGMCGPFVAVQVTARLDAIPATEMREWHRLQGAALLPYHLGRITTYMGLGAVAGGFSSLLFASPYVGYLAAAMLAGAGVAFLMYSFGLQGFAISGSLKDMIAGMSKPLWLNPTGTRGYVLGLLLGFLPCGLVMAALMASATTGSALGGAAGMMVFGLATVPALFLIGLGSQCAATRWRKETRMVARGVMAVNGIFFCALAAQHLFNSLG